LFIRLRLLGDIIFTLPALEIYKQNFPAGKIYYVVEDKFPYYPEPLIDENKIGTKVKDLLESRKDKVVIHVGAGNAFRDWGLDNFSALITRLTKDGTEILPVAGADVYVGVDSGPLHPASLTDTPLVALYGPNLPEISGPGGRRM
ncbi:MAG: glycosyltransferase family 9 protein, partial [bacterium]|nr:glycosyltransferase family 9 protein [bacterium]